MSDCPASVPRARSPRTAARLALLDSALVASPLAAQTTYHVAPWRTPGFAVGDYSPLGAGDVLVVEPGPWTAAALSEAASAVATTAASVEGGPLRT